MTVFYNSAHIIADNSPSIDNIQYSCTSVLDRSVTAYDITLHLQFDETFTPAVIGAIEKLVVGSFEINEGGNAIQGVATNRQLQLPSSVTQGPVALDILYNDFAQQTNGLGYSLSVSITRKMISSGGASLCS